MQLELSDPLCSRSLSQRQASWQSDRGTAVSVAKGSVWLSESIAIAIAHLLQQQATAQRQQLLEHCGHAIASQRDARIAAQRGKS